MAPETISLGDGERLPGFSPDRSLVISSTLADCFSSSVRVRRFDICPPLGDGGHLKHYCARMSSIIMRNHEKQLELPLFSGSGLALRPIGLVDNFLAHWGIGRDHFLAPAFWTRPIAGTIAPE